MMQLALVHVIGELHVWPPYERVIEQYYVVASSYWTKNIYLLFEEFITVTWIISINYDDEWYMLKTTYHYIYKHKFG